MYVNICIYVYFDNYNYDIIIIMKDSLVKMNIKKKIYDRLRVSPCVFLYMFYLIIISICRQYIIHNYLLMHCGELLHFPSELQVIEPVFLPLGQI